MNIIVKTAEGSVVVRPDTTWEKDNEDFFPPDFIDTLSLSPVVFVRICKPGKSIGRQFAARYYDSAGWGCLLYPEEMASEGGYGFAESLCIDHTSFLPAPTHGAEAVSDGRIFSILKDGREVSAACSGSIGSLEDALCEASARIYLRTGDLVALEMAPRCILSRRSGGNFRLEGRLGDDEILDFNVRYE